MSAPIRTVRSGSVQCAIFDNQATDSNGNVYNRQSFKLQKSYKDKSGKWTNTDYFGVYDIPNLSAVVTKLCMDYGVSDKAVSQNAAQPDVFSGADVGF